MTSAAKDWDSRLRENAQRSTVRRRNRPVVTALVVLAVALLLAGLLADLQVIPSWLAIICYAAAAPIGGVLLAFLYVKRLWVTCPPVR